MFPQNGTVSGIRIEQVRTAIADKRVELVGAPEPISTDKVELLSAAGITGIAVARVVFDDGIADEKTMLAIAGLTKEGGIRLARVVLEPTSRQKGLYFNQLVRYDERIHQVQVTFSNFEYPYHEQWKEVRTGTVEFVI